MTGWLRRIRGMIGTGLTWAVGWAIGGLFIGVSSILLPWLPWDGFFRIFDAPLPALAVPGFFAGMLFSVVLGIAGRNRRFEDLSLSRFAVWGGVGGLLLSLLPAVLVLLGLASTEGGRLGIGQFTAVIVIPLTLLSSASAAGSLVLARKAEDRALASGAGERVV
ncbi:MAG TPA: hypothetical protein VJU15_07855 [Gemmatimonadales bacterium]|nr:hypothetical protein [Gemmatimonadales bacterium]